VIKWKDIKRIGDDVILVDVAGIFETDANYEKNYMTKFGGYGDFDKDRNRKDE
jgi:hypothetical protein